MTTQLLNAIEYTPPSEDLIAENRDEFAVDISTVNTAQASMAGGNDSNLQGAAVDAGEASANAGNNNAENSANNARPASRRKKCDIQGCTYEKCPYKCSRGKFI